MKHHRYQISTLDLQDARRYSEDERREDSPLIERTSDYSPWKLCPENNPLIKGSKPRINRAKEQTV